MRFLCLDGPANGYYLTWADASALGYGGPSAREAAAWLYEPIVVWP